jgi:hypothetical protein
VLAHGIDGWENHRIPREGTIVDDIHKAWKLNLEETAHDAEGGISFPVNPEFPQNASNSGHWDSFTEYFFSCITRVN